MPCFKPAKMFDVSSVEGQTKNGKPKLKYLSYTTDYLFYDLNKKDYIQLYHNLYDNQDLAFYKKNPRYLQMPFNAVVTCGECDYCRLKHASDWANRMFMESMYHETFYFLTITYSDEYALKSEVMRGVPDPDTGEVCDYMMSLCKEHIQNFWRRLRKKNPCQLKYFDCGEYGDQTQRPHYHAIVYDLILPDDDLELYSTHKGQPLYTSKLLSSCWQYGNTGHNDGVTMGRILVSPGTWGNCAYVARYCLKKSGKIKNDYYEALNLEPMFQHQSNGFGKAYYEDHKEHIYKYDKIYLQTPQRGITARPPRYFDKLLEKEDPDLLDLVKGKRKFSAESMQKMREIFSELDYLDQLAIDEEAFKQRHAAARVRDQL